MIKAHARSAMTMNFVRSLIDGGFADLHHPEYWDLSWVGHSPLADEYQRMVEGIGDAVRFMETLSGSEVHNLNRVDFYTSHEALLLPYEEGQTREVPRQWGWFNLSTHFPWIGMRTAQLDGAHVEYFRGIRNPVGLKVGPSVSPDQLLRVIDVLSPDDEPGRVTLIHRMGAEGILLFDTYAGAASIAERRGLISSAAAARVIDAAREELSAIEFASDEQKKARWSELDRDAAS